MKTPGRIHIGVGAHEPIWHRLRTGNSAADEWQRWQQETSSDNLDLLERLGVTTALIACTKGFGLEMEKPLIERAARFAEQAAKRGIVTNVYVQGFPVYYEAFLLETPQAEGWLARTQSGDYLPWGGQTFRRWMDPTRAEFHEYEMNVLRYILGQFRPANMFMDNTIVHHCCTDSARRSFRQYLKDKYAKADPVREFGIPSFEAVDLPHFDPVYYPPDAYRIVKDPLLQEWARWRSKVVCDFLARLRELVHELASGTGFHSASGCDGLRYNQLFTSGVDFEDRIAALDGTHMEESWWRPGVVESTQAARRHVVMDERTPELASSAQAVQVRVSTDSRWWKLVGLYGKAGHGGLWGEVDRPSKLVALAHNMAFAQEANDFGTIGPLAGHERMLSDIADVIDWARRHVAVLTGRLERMAPVAVWRGASAIGFIRHQPVWEACAVEQMLYERHVPFTILLDGGLERFLDGRRVLVLPGTACVSDAQVQRISRFVQAGGNLLLLGQAGTRDELTRVRRAHAFAHLFGGQFPNLEHFGPPHWVPELDWSAMPERLSGRYGQGSVELVKQIAPQAPPDLSRDPYMPERQVMVKDVLPPANEAAIMAALEGLLGDDALRVTGPRWTLCEYWRRDGDMLICLANLHKTRDGGPVTIDLGSARARSATLWSLLDDQPQELAVKEGKLELPGLKHFAAVAVR